ncbi:MAG TPA: O-antigen polymerase [Candidatus Acidoferrum sp.]|nr:O-antigen polymerase [Candidatus Acidoferrum sp.]
MMIASPWVPLAVLFASGVGARLVRGSWLAPTAFPAVLWTIYGGIPLLLFKDVVSPITVWVIVILVFSTQFGAFIAEDLGRGRSARVLERLLGFSTICRQALGIVLACSLVAFSGAAVFLFTALRLNDLSLSWHGVMSLGALMYGVMVAGEAQPWWFRLTRMWAFPAVIVGGISFVGESSRKGKLLSFAGFIPVLLVGTTLASRFGTAMAIACWIGSYLAAKTHMSGGRFRFRKVLLVSGLSLFIAMVIMYVALGSLRGQKYGDFGDDYAYVGTNFFGYLSVFDNFVKSEGNYSRGFGQYSFAGAFDLLGIRERETALSYIPVMLENGVDSNIFTAFRGLIQDFSYPGAVLLLAVAGFFAGRAYMNSCRGNMRGFPILIAYYAFFLWSPIVSVFSYNSVALGILVVWLLVRRRAAKNAARTEESLRILGCRVSPRNA